MSTITKEQYDSLVASAQREGISVDQVNADIKKRGFDIPSPSYLERVDAAHQARSSQLQQDIAMSNSGKQSGITTAISGVRNAVGGVMDYVNEAPIIKPVLEGVGNAIGSVVSSAPVQALADVAAKTGPLEPILNPIGAAYKGYKQMEQTNPELAKNIGNIAGTVMDASTISGVGGAVKSAVKYGVASASKSLASRMPELAQKAATQTYDDATRVLSSTLPGKAEEKIIGSTPKAGKSLTTSKLGTNKLDISVIPEYDKMAKSISGVVHPSNNPGVNLDNVKVLYDANNKLRKTLLNDTPLPWWENNAPRLPNNNPITRVINTPSEDIKLLFNDKQMMKTYNDVAKRFEKFLERVDENGIPIYEHTVRGLHNAIVDFKNTPILKPFFGDTANGGLRNQAYKDINKNVRQYIADTIGGEKGQMYMKIGEDLRLQKQAMDQLAAHLNKSGKVGLGPVARGVRVIKENPLASGATGIAAGAGAYLVSPYLIPGIMAAIISGKTIQIAGKQLNKVTLAKFVTKHADDLMKDASIATDAAEKARLALEYLSAQELLKKLQEKKK